MEVAHPQSGSSSTWFLVELEFENVGFWGEGKTEVPGEKPLRARERTNNKLNPHMASTPGIWTRATFVWGDCSHHCTIPCYPFHKLIMSFDRREIFDQFFVRTRVASYYNKVYFQPLVISGEPYYLQPRTMNLFTERDVNMVMLMVSVGYPSLIQ